MTNITIGEDEMTIEAIDAVAGQEVPMYVIANTALLKQSLTGDSRDDTAIGNRLAHEIGRGIGETMTTTDQATESHPVRGEDPETGV